ncbi:unnamed protein product [Ranitomeya imitator]|uniref:Uncharacterized protein n=1 Tax=Ranitomeya imitator TaxID=111125 RepID=A0ABN9LM05_9NEOB|nr:unnamed protein product [Ranitomeya imitator]
MNGIIHPCTHPEDKPAPKNEDEMMVAIFEYIDRLFNIVRPRRLLYMAIDGVAPRAKMNQQRSRRFRASKEGVELTEEKSRIREEVISKGGYLPPEEMKERFDSNCITPGTEFMDNLAKCLRYYIADRLNNDPGWKNLTLSPIMTRTLITAYVALTFIGRILRRIDGVSSKSVQNNAADLIMLGLATHEPNFTIIREEFKPNQPKPCALCGQFGHELQECQGLAREKKGEHDEFADRPPGCEQEFIFIRLNVLREYLERELVMSNLPFQYDFERSVDDWVFMCFFVGNDFLPHLPSLEIREGAIDRLVKIYKDVVHNTGGYLTESGFVNLERVQMIMLAVGEVEDSIFKKRKEDDESFKRRQKEKKKRMKKRDVICLHLPPDPSRLLHYMEPEKAQIMFKENLNLYWSALFYCKQISGGPVPVTRPPIDLSNLLMLSIELYSALCAQIGTVLNFRGGFCVITVVPIFKMGMKVDPCNYVSLTSVVCKVFEGIIRDDLQRCIADNNVIT